MAAERESRVPVRSQTPPSDGSSAPGERGEKQSINYNRERIETHNSDFIQFYAPYVAVVCCHLSSPGAVEPHRRVPSSFGFSVTRLNKFNIFSPAPR